MVDIGSIPAEQRLIDKLFEADRTPLSGIRGARPIHVIYAPMNCHYRDVGQGALYGQYNNGPTASRSTENVQRRDLKAFKTQFGNPDWLKRYLHREKISVILTHQN